jgi:hypothetical protein
MEEAGRRSWRPQTQDPPRRLRRRSAQPQSLRRRHLLRRLQVPLRLRPLHLSLQFLLFLQFLQPRQQSSHPRHFLLQLFVRPHRKARRIQFAWPRPPHPQAIAATARKSVEQWR